MGNCPDTVPFYFQDMIQQRQQLNTAIIYSQRTQMPWPRIRAEHDEVFGKDLSTIGTQLPRSASQDQHAAIYYSSIEGIKCVYFLPPRLSKGPPRRNSSGPLRESISNRWNNNLDHAQRPAYKSRLLEGSQLFSS